MGNSSYYGYDDHKNYVRNSSYYEYDDHRDYHTLHLFVLKCVWATGQGMFYWWFLTSLSWTGYNFVWVCQQGVSCMIDLICLMNFVRTPKNTKAMTITWICSGVHFVLCRKQGMYFSIIFVLNRVRVSYSAAHLYQNIGQIPPGLVPCEKQKFDMQA